MKIHDKVIRQWEAPIYSQEICATDKETTKAQKTTYKIREHANGRFTCISYNFWYTRGTYGDFNSLEEAKTFMKNFDGVKKSDWTQTKGKRLQKTVAVAVKN